MTNQNGSMEKNSTTMLKALRPKTISIFVKKATGIFMLNRLAQIRASLRLVTGLTMLQMPSEIGQLTLSILCLVLCKTLLIQKVIAAKQRLDNAKRQLKTLETNNSDFVSDYTANKNTLQSKVKSQLRTYNILNDSKLDISIDGIINNAVFAYEQAKKNPNIASQIAIFWAIRDALREEYPEIANAFEGKI